MISDARSVRVGDLFRHCLKLIQIIYKLRKGARPRLSQGASKMSQAAPTLFWHHVYCYCNISYKQTPDFN